MGEALRAAAAAAAVQMEEPADRLRLTSHRLHRTSGLARQSDAKAPRKRLCGFKNKSVMIRGALFRR